MWLTLVLKSQSAYRYGVRGYQMVFLLQEKENEPIASLLFPFFFFCVAREISIFLRDHVANQPTLGHSFPQGIFGLSSAVLEVLIKAQVRGQCC